MFYSCKGSAVLDYPFLAAFKIWLSGWNVFSKKLFRIYFGTILLCVCCLNVARTELMLLKVNKP